MRTVYILVVVWVLIILTVILTLPVFLLEWKWKRWDMLIANIGGSFANYLYEDK